MNNSAEVSDILLGIVELATLRIRAAAWSGDTRRCEVEADHIHNIPALLRNFSTEALQYYWEVERPSFVDRCTAGPIDCRDFEPLWSRLGPLTKQVGVLSG